MANAHLTSGLAMTIKRNYNETLPCRKIGQIQPSATIILQNLKVLTIYGLGGHLGQFTWNIYAISLPFPKQVYEIWLGLTELFGKCLFKTVYNDYGRTPEHAQLVSACFNSEKDNYV